MVRKRQWFLLGLIGALVGLAMRLVRGRRGDDGFGTIAPPPSGER